MQRGFRVLDIIVAAALGACGGCSGGITLRVAHERLVLAPVEVSGVEGWFLVDTGTDSSLVTPALAGRLEPAGTVHHVSGFGISNQPVDVPRVKSGNIRFAGSRLKYPAEVSVLDLDFCTQWAGATVDGILGWDVLREYGWGLDVRGARLVAGRELSPQEILERFGVERADATVAIALVDELPFVTARAQGQPLELLLDTGAERTVLSADAWKRLGLEPPAGAPHAMIRGVNGDVPGYLARLAELQLGAVTWTEREVLVAETSGPGDRDGLLGMDLLSDYVIVMDGPSRTLRLARHPAEEQR
jgi:hypothetical protein